MTSWLLVSRIVMKGSAGSLLGVPGSLWDSERGLCSRRLIDLEGSLYLLNAIN